MKVQKIALGVHRYTWLVLEEKLWHNIMIKLNLSGIISSKGKGKHLRALIKSPALNE